MKSKKTLVTISCFLLLCCTSCNHTQKQTATINNMSIVASKDRVWKIMVKVLKTYPLKTIDDTLGYMETEVIKGSQFWKAPHQRNKDFYGYSYVVKAYLKHNKPFSTVTIHKTVYKQKGFISEKIEIPSDNLEETAIMYQINRELELLNALK